MADSDLTSHVTSKASRGHLALDGGTPVRDTMLPYGRQTVDAEDEDAVLKVLRSGWLTTGPEVGRFEEAFAARVGATHAVAVANGTAALHTAFHALGVGPGDDVLVPALTFAASATGAVQAGARPVFVDVDPDTLLVDPISVRTRWTDATRAVVGVDYAGQPCDWDALRTLAEARGAMLVDDAAHALGATWRGRPLGAVADVTAFSLHPVKHVTAGEGGVLTTNHGEVAERARRFRNHGISRDHRARAADATWEYEIAELGWNYRLSDLHCGLARAQLARLDGWLVRRRAIAAIYDDAFTGDSGVPGVRPLAVRRSIEHAYHLYVVRIDPTVVGADRRTVFRALRAENIGVNVHYQPVHLHPWFMDRFGTGPGDCPVAEAVYKEILTLPLFPGMSDGDAADVVAAVRKVTQAFAA